MATLSTSGAGAGRFVDAHVVLQVEFLTQKKNKKKLSLEETLAIVKDAFSVAGERGERCNGRLLSEWVR